MFGGPSSYGFHRIAQFMRCPQMYAYRWVLKLVPQTEGAATGRGTSLHEGLASWYRDGSVDGAFETMRALGARYAPFVDEAQRIFLNYVRHYAVEPFDVVAVEREIVVDIGDYPFSRRLDLVVKDHQHGLIWVYDHKTAGDVSDRLRTVRSDWSLLTQALVGEAVCQREFGEGSAWGGLVLNVIGTGSSSSQFVRQPVVFSEREMDAVPAALHWYLKQADSLSDRNPFDYPRSGACLGRYGMCEYRALCEGGPIMRRMYDEEE